LIKQQKSLLSHCGKPLKIITQRCSKVQTEGTRSASTKNSKTLAGKSSGSTIHGHAALIFKFTNYRHISGGQ